MDVGRDLQGGGDLMEGGGGDFTVRLPFFSGAGVPSGEGDLLPAMEASGDFAKADPSSREPPPGDRDRPTEPSVPAGDFNPPSEHDLDDFIMRGEGVLLSAA